MASPFRPDPLPQRGSADVRRAGVPIHFDVAGRGEHVTLVHGVGSSLESWDGIVPALGGRHRVLRYDLRGHGRSGKPAGPYALADFVEDLRALVDRDGARETRLVGFSFGGMIAQAFTLRHPEMVSRLVLISAVAGRTPAQRVALRERADALVSEGPGRTVDAAIERWFTPEFRTAHPEVVAQQRARVLANDVVGYPAAYRVFAETDLLGELAGIRCPTLVVTGEHDTGSTPEMARLMHERIAGSRLVILPRFRHSLLLEAAAEVAELLRAFLAEPAPALRSG